MITSSSKKAARHMLEEAFFRDMDSMIVSRLRSEADSQDARQLLQSTGLHDETLIDELTRLGVTAEGLIAMRLVPLVMVAWAEHGVDQAERETVLSQAIEVGIAEGSVAAVLLEFWLNKRPPAAILDAWKRYMTVELAKMSKLARDKLVTLMEHQMMAVANASGGYLGVGNISANEKQLIDMMTRVLRR
jgi:hypothetical protein